jgi:hypothetical protein
VMLCASARYEKSAFRHTCSLTSRFPKWIQICRYVTRLCEDEEEKEVWDTTLDQQKPNIIII